MPKKKQDLALHYSDEEMFKLEEGYYDQLEKNPKYSLQIDPENKYNMGEIQRKFIANYVQFKNVPLASKLTGIDEAMGLEIYNMYSTKMEIRRINLALYHRSFATRMLSIDEIGGYLTSLIIDENVAEADKLNKKDKLQVVKLMLDLNKLKQESVYNPNTVIDVVDIQEELQDLSVGTIQALIEKSKEKPNVDNEKDKEELIEELAGQNAKLSPEELAYLKTKSSRELMQMIDDQVKNSTAKSEFSEVNMANPIEEEEKPEPPKTKDEIDEKIKAFFAKKKVEKEENSNDD